MTKDTLGTNQSSKAPLILISSIVEMEILSSIILLIVVAAFAFMAYDAAHQNK